MCLTNAKFCRSAHRKAEFKFDLLRFMTSWRGGKMNSCALCCKRSSCGFKCAPCDVSMCSHALADGVEGVNSYTVSHVDARKPFEPRILGILLLLVVCTFAGRVIRGAPHLDRFA